MRQLSTQSTGLNWNRIRKSMCWKEDSTSGLECMAATAGIRKGSRRAFIRMSKSKSVIERLLDLSVSVTVRITVREYESDSERGPYLALLARYSSIWSSHTPPALCAVNVSPHVSSCCSSFICSFLFLLFFFAHDLYTFVSRLFFFLVFILFRCFSYVLLFIYSIFFNLEILVFGRGKEREEDGRILFHRLISNKLQPLHSATCIELELQITKHLRKTLFHTTKC